MRQDCIPPIRYSSVGYIFSEFAAVEVETLYPHKVRNSSFIGRVTKLAATLGARWNGHERLWDWLDNRTDHPRDSLKWGHISTRPAKDSPINALASYWTRTKSLFCMRACPRCSSIKWPVRHMPTFSTFSFSKFLLGLQSTFEYYNLLQCLLEFNPISPSARKPAVQRRLLLGTKRSSARKSNVQWPAARITNKSVTLNSVSVAIIS